jgi:hypothetical protein
MVWLVVYNHLPGRPNIVCGPFADGVEALTFVSPECNHTATALHDSLESALADNTNIAFVPA